MTADDRFQGACVAWGGYTVKQLADMFASENNPRVWSQVVAYRETHELLDQHMRELTRAKRDLEAMWPPERNESSRVFGAVMESLLTSMRQVGDAAVDNMAGLDDVAHSLANAKRDIDKLYQQWQQYEAQDKKDEVAGLAVKFWVEDPPDNWQDELQKQAAARMYTMDTEVSQGTDRMTVPDEYFLPEGVNNGTREPSGGSTGGSNGGGTGSGHVPGSMTPPYIPPPPPARVGPIEGSAGQGGAELAGGGRATGGSSAGGSGSGGLIGPMPGADAAAIGATAGFVGGAIGSGAFGGGSTGGGRPTGGVLRPVRAPGGIAASSGGPHSAPLPPGGVIGGARGSGTPVAGGTASSRTGGATTAAGAPGARGAGAAAVRPASGGRRGEDDDEQGQTFDPDNPWAVEEGGPAVIKPSPRPTRHDGGPGVIGIDR